MKEFWRVVLWVACLADEMAATKASWRAALWVVLWVALLEKRRVVRSVATLALRKVVLLVDVKAVQLAVLSAARRGDSKADLTAGWWAVSTVASMAFL